MMDGLMTLAGGPLAQALRLRLKASTSASRQADGSLFLSSLSPYFEVPIKRSERIRRVWVKDFVCPRRSPSLPAMLNRPTKGQKGNELRRFVMSMKIVVIGGT